MPSSYATLLSFLFFIFIFWGWGEFLPRKLPAGARFAAGLAGCAIFATVGYERGASVAILGRVAFGVATLGLIRAALAIRRSQPAFSVSAFFIPSAVAFMLLLPALLGDLQFSLFQGNIYDQFNYLATAVVRVTESSAAVHAATVEDFLRLPLITIAHLQRDARPAVVDLYAILEGVLPGNLHQAHYGYLCALLFVTFFGVIGFVRQKAGQLQVRVQLVGAAVVLGFWGQLQIDSNAWSWTAATPLVITALGLVWMAIRPIPQPASEPQPSLAIGLGLCTAGAIYFYPEIVAAIAPAVIGALILAAVSQRWRLDGWRTVLWATFLAFLLVIPEAPTLLWFGFSHLVFLPSTNAPQLDWWWQAILGSTLPATAWHTGIAWIISYAGLSWLPTEGALVWAKTLLVVAAFAGVWIHQRQGGIRLLNIYLIGLLGVLAFAIITLGYRGTPWLVGKAVSYSAIVFLPLLLLPITHGRVMWWHIPAWLLCALHLTFGCFRVLGAMDPTGIHYRDAYYPAVVDPALKTARTWNVERAPAAIRAARQGVKIDVPDYWLEAYASICVQAQGLPFFKQLPVKEYWDIGRIYGQQAERKNYEAVVYAEHERNPNGFKLAFALRNGAVFSERRDARIARVENLQPLDTAHGMLAWKMHALTGPAETIVTVMCSEGGTYLLEFGVLADEKGQDLEVGTGAPRKTIGVQPVLGLGLGTIQGLRLPITLSPGETRVHLTLRATAEIPPSAIRIINPILVKAPSLAPAPSH